VNVFVTDECPIKCAQVLPDKHVVKMALETCQMLSIVASTKWGHGYGELPRLDGTPYKTEKGAFRNHPCTVWANQSIHNASWLIKHGIALCHEYECRYGKVHSCYHTLVTAFNIFPAGNPEEHTPFVRAMPDCFKHDDTISTFDAYKMYIASKPWVSENYLREPERKPVWV
jgi:hypothetical protein